MENIFDVAMVIHVSENSLTDFWQDIDEECPLIIFPFVIPTSILKGGDWDVGEGLVRQWSGTWSPLTPLLYLPLKYLNVIWGFPRGLRYVV